MPVVYTARVNELPERAKEDFYPTPYSVALGTVLMLKKMFYSAREVLDPGCGTGVWGKAVREVYGKQVRRIAGFDIRTIPAPQDFSYDYWMTGNYLEEKWSGFKGYAAAIGNPPFNVAAEMIEHSFEYFKVQYVGFLLPADFLYTEKRMHHLYTKYPLRMMTGYAKRIPFTGSGNPNNYAFYLFDRSWRGKEAVVSWINIDTMQFLYADKMVSLIQKELLTDAQK